MSNELTAWKGLCLMLPTMSTTAMTCTYMPPGKKWLSIHKENQKLTAICFCQKKKKTSTKIQEYLYNIT